MKKRAVGYCRISTLMQVDNTSLKDQEEKIRMYAKLHDIVIDKMFIDKAVSGKSTDRPEYDKMMDYVKGVRPHSGSSNGYMVWEMKCFVDILIKLSEFL